MLIDYQYTCQAATFLFGTAYLDHYFSYITQATYCIKDANVCSLCSLWIASVHFSSSAILAIAFCTLYILHLLSSVSYVAILLQNNLKFDLVKGLSFICSKGFC